MFLLCREKERLYHAKPFTRGTTAVIGSIQPGPFLHYATQNKLFWKSYL